MAWTYVVLEVAIITGALAGLLIWRYAARANERWKPPETSAQSISRPATVTWAALLLDRWTPVLAGFLGAILVCLIVLWIFGLVPFSPPVSTPAEQAASARLAQALEDQTRSQAELKQTQAQLLAALTASQPAAGGASAPALAKLIASLQAQTEAQARTAEAQTSLAKAIADSRTAEGGGGTIRVSEPARFGVVGFLGALFIVVGVILVFIVPPWIQRG